MITRDVDEYVQKKYGKDVCHIFGTDTIPSMPEWDSEQYAAKIVKKLFVPRRLIPLSFSEGESVPVPERDPLLEDEKMR